MMGVRDVVATVSLAWFDSQADLSDLSDWVYHHEVLSKFSLRHWAPELAGHSTSPSNLLPELPKRPWEGDPRLVPCTSMQRRNNALRTLSEVVETVVSPSDPRSASPEYRDRLRLMRDEIEERLVSNDHDSGNPAEDIARLYRLATLIYLGRASGQAGARVDAHARAGLRLLGSLTECARPFALIVIGFEADTDEDREIVLDLVRRTEEAVPDPRLACMRRGLLQAIWNQNDLHASERTPPGYLDKLTAVISFCKTLPSFV
jgi:hypothetical protein